MFNIAQDNLSSIVEEKLDSKNMVLYSRNKLFLWNQGSYINMWITDNNLFFRQEPETLQQVQERLKKEKEQFKKLQEHLDFLKKRAELKKQEELQKRTEQVLEKLRLERLENEKKRLEEERLEQVRQEREMERRRREKVILDKKKAEEERKKKEEERRRQEEELRQRQEELRKQEEERRKKEEDDMIKEYMNRRQNKKHKISDATLKKLDKRFGKYQGTCKSKIRMFTPKQKKRILKLLGIKKSLVFESFFELHQQNKLDIEKVNRVNDYINTRIDRKQDPIEHLRRKFFLQKRFEELNKS
jgi:hypothetical protein